MDSLKNADILIIDDDEDVLTALRLLLKPVARNIIVEKNPNNISSLIQSRSFDVILLDMNFVGLINTGNEGIFWLNKIRQYNPKADVILITAYGDIDLAIRSLKEGASDFIVKPWKNDKLIASIRALADRKKTKRASTAQNTPTAVIGESTVMQDVFLKVKKVAPTDANVLILGENGTGKDLIAHAIHENSLRKDKPFIKVDVGALTSTLFESELFGYKKGAFTDAREDRKGRFEAAHGGTLFLDEIGNITLNQQARLLTVLQNRTVTPLGSNESVPVDIRLICATNIPLTSLADESRFRKDLLYRINTVDITIPPLRNRGSDIELLARHFLNVYSDKYHKSHLKADKSFLAKINSHLFPGNVRELQYIIERAVIMADEDMLTDDDIVFSAIENTSVKNTESNSTLEALEKNAILEVIRKHNGNISRSAQELGITRTALYRRLEKYGL